MKELLPVGCVIMASGLSQRFGSNKLLAPFCGEPMLCRAFAATDTPKLSARIVVTRSDEVAQLCRSRNVPVLLHDLPGRNGAAGPFCAAGTGSGAFWLHVPAGRPAAFVPRDSGSHGRHLRVGSKNSAGTTKRNRTGDLPSGIPGP